MNPLDNSTDNFREVFNAQGQPANFSSSVHCNSSSFQPKSSEEVIESLDESFQFFVLDQFANFHSPLLAQNTALQGSSTVDSIDFWVEFLELCLQGPGKIFNLDIKNDDVNELLTILRNYKSYTTTLHSADLVSSDHPSHVDSRKKIAEKLHTSIKDQLKKYKYAYMNQGYRGSRTSSGHHIPCRLTLVDKKVFLYPLNKGAGSEDQALLDVDETRYLQSFRNFPTVITLENVEGDLFLEKIGKDISLAVVPPSSKDYDAEDTLGSIRCLGELSTEFVDGPITNWVGKQHIGNICASKGVHMIILDFLICKNYSSEFRKKLFYCAKLASIISAHHYFKDIYKKFGENKVPFPSVLRNHLIQACIAYSNSIEKVFTRVLTIQELDLARIIINSILNHAKSIKDVNFEVNVDEVAQDVKFIKSPFFKKEQIIYHPIIETQFDNPELLAHKLEQHINKILDKDTPFEKIQQEVQYLLTIQELIFSEKTKEFLDKIPVKYIPKFVSIIRNFVVGICAHNQIEKLSNFNRLFIASYNAYAIADYLVRKNKNLKLEGFYSPFWPSESQGLSSVTFEGKEHFQYLTIADYFKISIEGRKPLFSFFKVVSSADYSNEYYDQFIDLESPSANEDRKDLWVVNNYHKIPKEFYDLRDISFFCHFFVKAKSGIFPIFFSSKLYSIKDDNIVIPYEFEYFNYNELLSKTNPNQRISALATSSVRTYNPEDIGSIIIEMDYLYVQGIPSKLEKFYLTVPCPKSLGQNSPCVWDAISKDQIPAVVKCFKESLSLMLNEYDFKKCQLYTRKYLAAYAIYAIVDYLIRKLPNAKLDKFYSQNWTTQFKYPFPVFHIAAEEERYIQLNNYFESIKKNREPLFYFARYTHIANGIKSLKSNYLFFNEEDPSVKHIRYLDQFWTDYRNLGTSKDLSSETIYENLWLGNGTEKVIPSSFYDLRYVSYVCKLMIFAKEGILDQNVKDHIFTKSRRTLHMPSRFGDISDLSKINKNIDRHTGRSFVTSHKSYYDYDWLPNENKPFEVQFSKDACTESSELSILFRISLNKKTAPAAILEWLDQNREKIISSSYQVLIEQSLLAREHLNFHLHSHEFTVKASEILLECLQFYASNESCSNTTLFLLHLIFSFESHRLNLHEKNKNFRPTTAFVNILERAKIRQQDKKLYAAYMLCLYDLFEQLPNQFIPHFISTAFLYTSKETKQHWIETYAEEALANKKTQIEEFYKSNPEVVRNICIEILKENFDAEFNQSSSVLGLYPTFKVGNYILSFLTFEVSNTDGQAVKDLPPACFEAFQDASYKYHNLKGSWVKAREWESIDKTLRIEFESNNKMTVRKKIRTNGSLEYCIYESLITKYLPKIFEKFFSNHTFWIGSNDCIWIVNLATSITEYCLKGNVLYKTNPEGKILDIVACNFYSNLSNVSLNAVIFYSTLTRHSVSIHYPLEKIDFVYKDQLFKSSESDDFYLLKQQSIGLLEGCIFMKSDWGEVRVLVPFRELNVIRTKNNLNVEFTDAIIAYNVPYYSFSYSQSLQNYHSDIPSANLFLAYLFSAQDNFTEALKYLERSKKTELYDNRDWCVIKLILKSDVRTPEALGFFLKLAYMIYKNQELPIYSDPNYKLKIKEFQTQIEEIKDLITKHYTNYLQSIHNDTSNQIPHHAKLSRKQELKLLSKLKLENYILQQRSELLNSPSLKIFKSISSHFVKTVNYIKELEEISFEAAKAEKYDIHAFSAKEGVLNSDFVRIPTLNGPTIISLINRALTAKKNVPHPIDLDIFFLSRQKDDKFSFIAALLLYIRNQPSSFSQFKFANDPAENLKTFKSIVAHANKLDTGLTNSIFSFGRSIVTTICGEKAFFHPNPVVRTLELLPSKKIVAPIPYYSFKASFKENLISPLRQLRSHFLPEKILQKASPEFDEFLETLIDDKTSNIEKEIIDEIKQGNKSNKSKSKIVYKFVEGTDPKQIESELKSQISKDTLTLRDLAAKIEVKANTLSSKKSTNSSELANDLRLALKQIGKQIPHLTIESPLITSILMLDSSKIQRYNALEKSKLSELINLVTEYICVEIRKNMSNKALKLIEKRDSEPNYIQNLGELCFWENPLDPFKYPEIPVYMFNSGMIPRPNQLDVLKWIFDLIEKAHEAPFYKGVLDKFMFAFEAGGGKTSIVQTITLAFIRRSGYLPVSISSDALYYLDKANQKSYMQSGFHQHMSVIESSLNIQLGEEEINNIHHHLNEIIAKRYHLKMQPESYANLYLLLLKSLELKHTSLIDPLITILFKNFEGRGFALLDECRQTGTSSSTFKIALGKQEQLKSYESTTILQIVSMMIGMTAKPVLVNGKTLSSLLKLDDKNSSLTEDEWSPIKSSLANELIQTKFGPISQADQKELFKFWTDFTAPTPKWILELLKTHPEKGEELVLIRGLLCHILPKALKLKYKFGYSRSIKRKEEFYTPRIRTKSSSAIYEDPYLTLFLTYRGILQKGLSKPQIAKLVKRLQQIYLHEIQSNTPEKDRVAENLWNSFTHNKFPSLNEYRIDEINLDPKLIATLKRNQESILWYINESIVSTITFSEYQYEVTPIDLMNGFKRILFFSAYPGLRQQYPLYAGDTLQDVVRTDAPFVANVFKMLLEPQNQKKVVFPSNDLDQMLEHLLKTDRELFKTLSAFIDVGGMQSAISTETFARKFLKFSEENNLGYQGFLFFKSSKTTVNDDAPIYLLRKSDGEIEKLLNTDIPESLKYLGLRWDQLKLATLYDPSKTTGAHVLQPKKGFALFMLDKNVPLGEAIQAVMRMREFLLQQSIIWGMTQEVEADIARITKSENVNPKTIAKWFIKNEKMLTETEVISHAYKGIEHYIKRVFINRLANFLGNPEAAIDEFSIHKGGFRNEGHLLPSQRFLADPDHKSIADTLWKFAREFYSKFKYRESFEKNENLINQIERIIIEVKDLIHPTSLTLENTSANQGLIHKVQEQEQTEDNLDHRLQSTLISNNKIAAEPLYYKCVLGFERTDFIENLRGYSVSGATYFKSKSIYSCIYYTDLALNTLVTQKGEKLNKYKPLNFFLVVKDPKHQLHFFGISDYEAAIYFDELGKTPTKKPVNQYMIVNSKGWILLNPKNSYQFEKAEEILKTDLYKQTVCQVSFLNGDLYHPEQFVKFVESNPNFAVLWKTVKEIHIFPESINAFGIEKIAFGKSGGKT